MVVNSHNIEFGYELISVLPYAYWLHINGKLKKTISGNDTNSLYYFSPDHEINPEERSWYNTDIVIKEKIPNIAIHRHELDLKQFAIPPYKTQYANDEYKYDKPIVCICNRYNIEWSTACINFFSLNCLKNLFDQLKDKYQIIYFGVDLPAEIQDNAKPRKLGDYKFVKDNYPEVIIFQDLRKGKSWNETMLKVFANCERFITMNGGYSILASFFGGTNVIYSKPGNPQCKELTVNSFWRWYPTFANSRVIHAESHEKLIEWTKRLWIKEKPTVNILIRTSGRKNYLNICMRSIRNQTYKNINVIMNIDNIDSISYTRQYKARLTQFIAGKQNGHIKPKGNDYGIWFPYNEYLDKMQRLVDGWIICLDDDDIICSPLAIKKLEPYMSDTNNFIIWKTKHEDRIIPSDENWESRKIECCDISGIGYMYHSSMIEHTDWSAWKRADFRTARNLSKVCNVIWHDEVLTKPQNKTHMGDRRDIEDCDKTIFCVLTDADGRKHNQYFQHNEFNEIRDALIRAGWKIQIKSEEVI